MNRLFVDNLTVIDSAFLDHHRGLVGESWIVDVELAGELDDQGMVFDFGLVKRTIKSQIDGLADHRLLIPAHQPGLTRSEHNGQDSLRFPLSDDTHIDHTAPASSVLYLQNTEITPDAVARYLETALKTALPDNVDAVRLHLRTEIIDGPRYHYTHGLKKHDGNCQRIAHGHRSRLEILRNHQRDPALEQHWAQRWQDIYIATAEDCTERFDDNGTQYHHFAYTANQGHFSLTLPAQRVYTIDTDSTVEWIAVHLLQQCQHQHPDDHLLIKAYEGVGKGALAATADSF